MRLPISLQYFIVGAILLGVAGGIAYFVGDELLQRANDLEAGSVTVGHSMVSMPSSYPAYHLLESFGEMPRGSIMVPGSDAREFAHFHATFLHDTDPLVVSKKKRGELPKLFLWPRGLLMDNLRLS